MTARPSPLMQPANAQHSLDCSSLVDAHAASRHSSDAEVPLCELKLHHGLKADASIHRYHGTYQCGIAFTGQGVFIFRPRFQKRPPARNSSPKLVVTWVLLMQFLLMDT